VRDDNFIIIKSCCIINIESVDSNFQYKFQHLVKNPSDACWENILYEYKSVVTWHDVTINIWGSDTSLKWAYPYQTHVSVSTLVGHL